MEELVGRVEYALYATGTKSESVRPYLVKKDGVKILLYKEDENPFENSGFVSFEGKKVSVLGEMKNTAFVVNEIKEVSDEIL